MARVVVDCHVDCDWIGVSEGVLVESDGYHLPLRYVVVSSGEFPLVDVERVKV